MMTPSLYIGEGFFVRSFSLASGYSLWLVPDVNSEAYRILKRCIDDLAQVYQTPSFVPHITLLGGVQDSSGRMQRDTKELAGRLHHCPIQLDAIGSNGIYFQILFARVKPVRAIYNRNTEAKKFFGIHSSVCYVPHLSLAYGNLSSEQVRALQHRLSGQSYVIPGIKFLARKMELWYTQGPVQDWTKIEVFPLVP
jgi:2'-5' RNA ligase